MKKIAIFASGSGSNAENLAQYFKKNKKIKIALIVCNNPKAGVIERANRLKIPVVLISNRSLNESSLLLKTLKSEGIDLLVLAGFLKRIPENLILAFPKAIVNLHPSLLPKFGGKGMYGDKVHQAVVQAKEKESGISIHFVDAQYDTGELIEQIRIPISENETPENLAKKIHQLEYEHYPKVIENLIDVFF